MSRMYKKKSFQFNLYSMDFSADNFAKLGEKKICADESQI